MYPRRLRLLSIIITLIILAITARLFYWQVMSADQLQAIAEVQQSSTVEIPSQRGRILSSDGFPLVANQPAYLFYAYLPYLEDSADTISQKIAPIISTHRQAIASQSAMTPEEIDSFELDIYHELMDKLSNLDIAWTPLQRNLSQESKQAIDQLHLAGLDFEQSQIRYYPEASMAAQLTGFVGSDAGGKPQGYFGLEGFYNLELRGKSGYIRQEKDASGKPIVVGRYQDIDSRDGRDIQTYIDRGLQFTVEKHLQDGLEQYGAASGEVIIMDPKTGGIMALASLPGYDPAKFRQYDPKLYRLPSITDTYEPGSTFKVLVVAAALEAGAIEPDERCYEDCAQPVQIGKYSIHTWNDEYNPGQTITEILQHSDNVGMIYIARKLGKDTFVDYLRKFGVGQATNIDLEGETTPELRDRWGDIDLAVSSFGQGLAVTSIQMITAIASLANDGVLMEPHVVQKVISHDRVIDIAPRQVRQVISPDTAAEITKMMVAAVHGGEAQWAVLKDYKIAGKTGTAQIPISGHYDTEKTIASFIGFAPADDPKFVMLVKLREPTTSPWAAETAAPLWMNIAKDVFFHLNIPPNP